MLHKVYELDGKSLEAAQELWFLVKTEIQDKKPQNFGNFGEIREAWNKFYQDFIQLLKDQHPETLKATGLDSPSLCINQGVGGMPRCYREFPSIFIAPTKKLMMYMYVPVNYNDIDFVPEDAHLLNDVETKEVGNLLFAGGWLDNSALVDVPREGVAMPFDYKRARQKPLTASFNNDTYDYLVTGQALAAVKAFQKAKVDYSGNGTRIFDRTAELVELISSKQDNKISRKSVGMMMCNPQIAEKENYSGIELTGTDDLPANPYFKIRDNKGRSPVVLRHDTPEGREYAKMFENRIEPELKDFLNVEMGWTVLTEYNGQTFVSFREQPSPLPNGLKAVSADLMHWIKADAQDINTGVTPPPMPTKMRNELARLSVKATLNQRQNPININARHLTL